LCGSETVSFFEGRTQIKNIYTYEWRIKQAVYNMV
jgi:hypothetical protein